MRGLSKNVWVLVICQALMMSSAPAIIFAGGFIGAKLAPSQKLATLPIAFMIIGAALASIPVALMMQHYGRKRIFIAMVVVAIAGALIAMVSIHHEWFIGFCFGATIIGCSVAATQQYRFAAMESVQAEFMPKAASYVLFGGIVAAFLGPELVLIGKDLIGKEYIGSFFILIIVYCTAIAVLSQFKNSIMQITTTEHSGRSLWKISRQNVFWVAVGSAMVSYTVMSFIMTATPMSMHVMDGHSLESTKFVIQSHIAAMFVPSLLTASLIYRFGIGGVMLLGLLVLAVCIGLAASGHSVMHYWWALVLLGIGWNFLFIGGTTLLPQCYTPEERFKTQALNDFMVFGAQAIASATAGWFVYQYGWRSLVLIGLPLLIIQVGLIALWRFTKVKPVVATKALSSVKLD